MGLRTPSFSRILLGARKLSPNQRQQAEARMPRRYRAQPPKSMACGIRGKFWRRSGYNQNPELIWFPYPVASDVRTQLLFAEGLSRLERLIGLVPSDYAAYRPLVRDALLFFLGQLPVQRFEAIIAEQLALPGNASNARRLVALFRQCPTLHKLGQVVARDRRLSPELRRRLQTLESLPATMPAEDILPQILRATRQVTGLKIGRRVLAEASVAQILPFVWSAAPEGLPQAGVFKVLRPGVVDRLGEELAIWPQLGDVLEERCRAYGLPQFDYRNTLESVARLLRHEIRLDREQAHLAWARQAYAGWPQVLIPRLYPFCSAQVTAMERVVGGKVTEAAAAAPVLRYRAHLVAEALLAFPFWENGRFHADPHAGNLMVAADGRLAILDWALMTQLDKNQCERLMQLILGALSLDSVRVCRRVAELGTVRDAEVLRAGVVDALQQVRWGRFPGFDWLTSLFDRLAGGAAVHFPEELILFRKALLTLNGVVSDISGQASIDSVLLGSGAVHFFRNLKQRLTMQSGSRGAGVHLSTQDLMQLWAESPAAVLRFWFGGF